jgi:hypothetical protein
LLSLLPCFRNRSPRTCTLISWLTHTNLSTTIFYTFLLLSMRATCSARPDHIIRRVEPPELGTMSCLVYRSSGNPHAPPLRYFLSSSQIATHNHVPVTLHVVTGHQKATQNKTWP